MTRPRLTLLHGFTQTGRSFGPLLPELSRHFDVVAPDLPGHGTRASAPAPLEESVRLVAEEGGRGFWLGYSMGARVALRLALDHPELVERLVLVSGTAGIEDADERAARRQADDSLAKSLEVPAIQDADGQEEALAKVLEVPADASRGSGPAVDEAADASSGGQAVDEAADASSGGPAVDEAADVSSDAERRDAFLENWLAQPMFAGLSPEAAGMDTRRENTAAGLAGALRLLGQGSFEPVWDRLFGLHLPVLLVAGERDDAYCEQALRLGAWLGQNATLAMVPGAGHACHLEAPDAFLDLAVRFLSESQ